MVSLKCLRKLSPKSPSTPLSGGKSWHSTTQIRNFLPNSSGRLHVYARSIFNAAAGNNALAVQSRVGRVISELRHYIGRYNGQARPGVEDDRDQQRGTAIRRFK
jgi:hypothetical protein